MARLRAISVLFLLLVLMSCRQGVLRQMEEIEQYVHDQPDSALSALSALDSTACASGKSFARRALLTSYARYRAYVDESDPSEITVAADYFRQHNDTDRLMKALFFKGYIHECRREYNQAIVAFSEAEPLAEDLHNPYFAGMICREMASIFEDTFSYSQSLHSIQKAIRYYESGGYDLYASYARLQEADIYGGERKYSESDSVLTILISEARALSDTSLLARAMLAHVQNLVLKKDNCPVAAVQCIQYVKDTLHYSLPYYSCLMDGYAQAFLGRTEESERLFDQAKGIAVAPIEKYYSDFYAFKADKLLGKESKALEEVSRAIDYLTTEEHFSKIDLAVKAQRDYFIEHNRANQLALDMHRQRTRGAVLIGFLVFAICFLSLVSFYKKRERILKREKEELVGKIITISGGQSKRLKTGMQSGMGFLGQLVQVYWQNQPEKVVPELQKLLEGMRSDDEIISGLMQTLNTTRDNLMIRLEEQVPSLKKTDLLLYSYLANRLDHPTICAILQKNAQALNSQIYRLRQKIEKSSAVDKSEFLDVIS